MIIKLRSFAGIILAAMLLTATPLVAAVETNSTSTDTNSSTQTATVNSRLQERLKKYETDYKEHLSTYEQDHLKLHCQSAQGIITSADARAGKYAPERVKAYEELQTILTNVIAKLKAKGIDTTTLSQEQTVLAGKAAQIKTDFDTYKQQLSDIKDMDCTTDPAGFKAALTAARSTHETLAQEITDIKAYVTDTIKPELLKLRQEVKDKQTTTTQGGN